jgi:GNAT superfamily N-acetyltransferase
MYVLPDSHGAGISAALMTAALDAADLGAKCVWLGVNQLNQRAQRFYAKHGFTINGTKTFRLGAGIENDYVMVRPVCRPKTPALKRLNAALSSQRERRPAGTSCGSRPPASRR